MEQSALNHKDLQQIAVVIAVDQDAETLHLLHLLGEIGYLLADQPFGEHVVVGRRGVQELDAGAAHALDRGRNQGHVEGYVLHTRAVVGLDEAVNLACLVVGGDGLVVGELDPRLRIPHDDGGEAGPASSWVDVGGVEENPPVLLKTHDVAQPRHVGFDGEEVGGDVVDDLETVGIGFPTGLERLESRGQRARGPLDETETDISQRSGDVEVTVRPSLGVSSLNDLGAHGGAPLGQCRPRRLQIAHPKTHHPHPVGVPLEPALSRRAALARRHADAPRLAGGKEQGILATLGGLTLGKTRHHGHVQHLGVEFPAAFDIGHHELVAVVANDPEPGSLACVLGHHTLPEDSRQEMITKIGLSRDRREITRGRGKSLIPNS